MIHKEIEKATDLFKKYKRALLEDPHMVSLIIQYKESIQKSHLTMKEIGVIEACSSCARVKTSGCCFSGVEDWYDCYLLLINLLLGRELPVKTDFSESCLFVGENGCKLMARHSFCVNFLCPDLLEGFASAQRKNLSTAVGAELQAGWELENALRNWMKSAVEFTKPVLRDKDDFKHF